MAWMDQSADVWWNMGFTSITVYIPYLHVPLMPPAATAVILLAMCRKVTTNWGRVKHHCYSHTETNGQPAQSRFKADHMWAPLELKMNANTVPFRWMFSEQLCGNNFPYLLKPIRYIDKCRC